MPSRRALPLLVCCAWLFGAAPAPGVPTVYGLELEVDAERERLLIFADAPLEPELIPVDERTLMVALPGAVLDPSAPTRLAPQVQGTVVRVTAFERADPGSRPEVRVVVQRRPGEPPRVERRESLIAVDFEPLPRAAPGREDTVAIAWQRAPMQRVVTELAQAAGETLIFDEAVAGLGSITIEGPGRISRGEALALLDTLLLLKGYAALPSPGGARKVVQISGATGPWVGEGELPDSDAPVTTLLRLETVDAAEIAALLAPYVGAHATAVAYEPTNSLILAGAASRLARLRSAVEALDAVERGVPVFWSLEHADAEVVAEQVREVLGPREVPWSVGDLRTNTVLLRVRPETLDRARALVDRLDRPSRGAGALQVIRLRNADPETLAEQLLRLRADAPAAAELDPVSRQAGLRGLDFHVVAEPATRSLVLRSSPEALGAVLDTVRALDRVPPSVRVDVMVATVTIDDRLDLGFDYFIPTLTDPKAPDDLIAAITGNPSGGGIQQFPSADRPFVASFVRAPLLLTLIDPVTGQPFVVPIPRESFSLTLNDREVRTDTLLRPQLLVTSGEEQEVFAGDNVPVPVARAATEGEGATEEPFGRVTQNIERYDVGTTLRVTPTVGQQGDVMLELTVEVSSLQESLAGDVEEVGPSLREIGVQSTIRLRHGEVAVIATDAEPVTQETVTGVPWLKDIPVLGFLFRSTSETAQKRFLLVSAQAEILRPETRDLARALDEQLGALELSER